jgi:hypothetical protein
VQVLYHVLGERGSVVCIPHSVFRVSSGFKNISVVGKGICMACDMWFRVK